VIVYIRLDILSKLSSQKEFTEINQFTVFVTSNKEAACTGLLVRLNVMNEFAHDHDGIADWYVCQSVMRIWFVILCVCVCRCVCVLDVTPTVPSSLSQCDVRTGNGR